MRCTPTSSRSATAVCLPESFLYRVDRMVRQMRVVLGGTFDLLHTGHEALLRAAFDGRPEAGVIGLTTDRFAKESRPRVNPYVVRERNLKRCLAARKWRHARIEPIGRPKRPADDLPGLV